MDGWKHQRRIDLQKIILSQSWKKILSEYAEKQKPNESCAILYGKQEEICDVFFTENIENSPTNFTISNKQLIQAYDIAKEKKMDLVSIFHSHPNSDAHPSNTDKKFMQVNPIVWIIYSGLDKKFKAYIFNEKNTIEIPIKETY